MKVWAYVDGFNLYNGALIRSSWKWLDLQKLCRILLRDEINHIKYFTAKVNARVNDPDQPKRQMIYWRALRTIPSLEIIEGQFMTRRVHLPLASSIDQLEASSGQGISKPEFVEVLRSEEKGTDVNLAVHLVKDAFLNRYEAALIISNDSDLLEAVNTVREIGKTVIIYTPHRKSPSVQLKNAATLFRKIENKHLRECLFPDSLSDNKGDFRKPSGW